MSQVIKIDKFTIITCSPMKGRRIGYGYSILFEGEKVKTDSGFKDEETAIAEAKAEIRRAEEQ